MPVIAIVNRKGGSGKSTLATHIASYWARQHKKVMLGDIDRQQSSRDWLNLRPPQLPAVSTWEVNHNSTLVAPKGVTHVVLDTPGGLHGFDLAKVISFTDMLLIPIHNSLFDLASSAQCYAELQGLPHVINGRCRVAAVGMRIDNPQRANPVLQAWTQARGLTYLGSLSYSMHYPAASENGGSIFDFEPQQVNHELQEWEPILSWVNQGDMPQKA